MFHQKTLAKCRQYAGNHFAEKDEAVSHTLLFKFTLFLLNVRTNQFA